MNTVSIVNFAPGAALQDADFVLLAPYCEAPCEAGRQVFDRESAETLAKDFNSRLSRLLRRLPFAKAAVPCYNGHPDMTDMQIAPPPEIQCETDDKTIYAVVNALEVRDDGLYGRLERRPELEALKAAKGRLEISPFWVCRRVAERVLKPVKLISLGFVKRGRLPNAAVVNAAEEFTQNQLNIMNEEQIKRLAEILGVDPEAAVKDPETLIAAAAEQKPKSEPATEDSTETTDTASEKPAGGEPKSDEPVEEKPAEDDKDKQLAAANAAVEFSVKNKLEAAIANGQISLAQKPDFERLLRADFAAACNAIDALPKAFKSAQAEKAAERAAANAEAQMKSKQETARAFLAVVNSVKAAAREKGYELDDEAAITKAKQDPEGEKLWAQLKPQYL